MKTHAPGVGWGGADGDMVVPVGGESGGDSGVGRRGFHGGVWEDREMGDGSVGGG